MEFIKPKCKLVGEDGNVFNIIYLVSIALKKAGYPEIAQEWRKEAMNQSSYDDVLTLFHKFVEAE